MPVPVVIYARYSSDNQREESIEGQIRVCKDFAAKNDMEVVAVYADRAMSGRNDRRPDYQRMLRDAKKRAFRHVLVWKGDRISRDRYDKASCRATLKKYSVSIVSVTEAIPDGAEGILLESLLDGMAEYYSVNLAENTLRGMKENALKCKHNGGCVPFGYIVDSEGHYQLAGKAETEAIKEVFERYARGEKLKDILDYCAQVGVKSAARSKLTYCTLGSMISNPIYKGTYKFADTVTEGGIPAIVSVDLWERANHMKSNGRKQNGNKSNQLWSLTGKLTCGCCESPMVGDSGTGRGKKYYYYTCNGKKKGTSECDLKSYPKEELEERICHVLEEVIRSDEFRGELVSALTYALEEARELDNTTKPLTDGRLAEVNKRIKNLTEALAMGSTSITLIRELEKAEEEATDLEIEQKRQELSIPETISADEVEFFFIDLKERSETEGDNARDMLLQTLLHHAVVCPDKLEIALNYTIDEKRAALIAKDGSHSPELVRMSIDWLPVSELIRTIALCNSFLILTVT